MIPERVKELVAELTEALLLLRETDRETALEPLRERICLKCHRDHCSGFCDYNTPLY